MAKTRRKKVSVRRSPLKTMHTKALRIAARMKKVRAAPKPTADDLVSLSRPEQTTGRGKAVPSTSFTKAERRQVTDDRLSPVKKAPRWVYALISRGASRKEVLDRAEERIKRSPTRANHLLAQALLQEFGRPKRGALKIRERITHPKLSPLMKKEQ